jgi:hypothetical protein
VIEMGYMFSEARNGVFCQYLCWDMSDAVLNSRSKIGTSVNPGPRHSLFVSRDADCECAADQTLNPVPGHRGVCAGNTAAIVPVKEDCSGLTADDVASFLLHIYILLACFLIVLLAPCVYHKLAGCVATSQKAEGTSSDSSSAPPASSRSSRCLGRVRACWTPLVAVCCMQVMSLGDFATDIAVYSAMVLRGELPCQFGGLGDKVSCDEYENLGTDAGQQVFVDSCQCYDGEMHFDAECHIDDLATIGEIFFDEIYPEGNQYREYSNVLEDTFESSCVLQIASHSCNCRNLNTFDEFVNAVTFIHVYAWVVFIALCLN